MPLDAYSLCPGGTGKKIKFCCPDFLPELQKIERMLEGDQNLACLKHIDGLLESNPDRPCLLATKALLLRITNQLEAASVNAKHFFEKHPENATALSEMAILAAVEGESAKAIDFWQQAMVVADGRIDGRVYEAMTVVAQAAFGNGDGMAARAIWQLQAAIHQEDSRPMEMLLSYHGAPNLPVLMKESPHLIPTPAEASWKPQMDEALAPMDKGCWRQAVDRLAALTDTVDWPPLWRNLATLRSWLADNEGCVAALRKYASLDVPLEDAVEAEALAMLCSEDPIGDGIDLFSLTWNLSETDELQAALTLEPLVVALPVDERSDEDEGPPPRAMYMLLDRATPKASEGLTVEQIPRYICQLRLFGRQTDREARLEAIGATENDVEQVKQLIGKVAQRAISSEPEQVAVMKTSGTEELLQRKWRLPEGTEPAQIAELSVAHERRVIFEQWPELPLSIFDGRSPRAVSGDESCRVRLLAAILILQSYMAADAEEIDFNELRQSLGLPTLDPLDPTVVDVNSVPLARLSRIEVEKLSDTDLLHAFRRAAAYGLRGSLRRFAVNLIDRPTLADTNEQRRALSILARDAENPDEGLKYAQRGREMAEKAGQSPASWLILELSLQFARGDSNEINRLLTQIQRDHMNEPGVAQALTELLVGLGVLRPDGMPAGAIPGAGMPGGPAIGPAPQAAQEPGRLWTPGSEQGGGGEKKLWTPD